MPNASERALTEDYEDLYENAPCGYLSLAPDGHIIKANATLADWLGFSSEELLSKKYLDLLNIPGRIFFETHFAPLLRMQGFFNEVALDLLTKNGAKLPVLVNAAERRDGSGRHLLTRVTLFNATDRRRYERELVAEKARADAAHKELHELHAIIQANLLDEQATSALREQFIAVLGHDLRNPLASIAAGVELIRRTPLNEKANRIAGLIQASTHRMAGLIEDVMDFARGRLGGGLSLDRNSDESLEPVLRQIVRELQVGSPDRVIESYFEFNAPVNCDRRRIGQLASNLLANAITHGDPEIPITLNAATSDNGFKLSVANGGKPIPGDVLERIFQPFSRGSLRTNLEGLGLGLYIAHSIALAHDGSLEVSSTAKETRFTFKMPITAGKDEPLAGSV